MLTPACECGDHWEPIIHVGPMEWCSVDQEGYVCDFTAAKQCPKCGAFWQPIGVTFQ